MMMVCLASKRTTAIVYGRATQNLFSVIPAGGKSIKQKIGFVGIGLKVTPLARHFISANYPVVVHDVGLAKVDAIVLC